jgi:hypothetical protein
MGKHIISHLEEEVLFRLSKRKSGLTAVAMQSISTVVLETIHQTLLQLQGLRFVNVVVIRLKSSYRITATGLGSLQHNWR